MIEKANAGAKYVLRHPDQVLGGNPRVFIQLMNNAFPRGHDQ